MFNSNQRINNANKLGNQLQVIKRNKNELLNLPISMKLDHSTNQLVHNQINKQLTTTTSNSCSENVQKKCSTNNCNNYFKNNEQNNIVWYSNLARLNKDNLIKKICSQSMFRVDFNDPKIIKIEVFPKIDSFKVKPKSSSSSLLMTTKQDETLNDMIKVKCVSKYTRPKTSHCFGYNKNIEQDDQDYLDYESIMKRWKL
jgi:hypothetical protein